MKLQLEIPDAIRVVNQTTYKGHEVTVVYLFGIPAMYLTNKDNRFSNEDWKDILSDHLSRILATQLVAEFPDEWSLDNPTGRELHDSNPVVTLVEEKEDA